MFSIPMTLYNVNEPVTTDGQTLSKINTSALFLHIDVSAFTWQVVLYAASRTIFGVNRHIQNSASNVRKGILKRFEDTHARTHALSHTQNKIERCHFHSDIKRYKFVHRNCINFDFPLLVQVLTDFSLLYCFRL